MPEDPTAARNFAQLISSMEDGRLHGDISDAQRDLIGDLNNIASMNRKAKGSITITLEYAIEDGVVEVRGDFKTKAPKLPRGKSIFFATPDNNLTRSDPKQPSLEFRDVSIPRAATGLA